MNPDAKPFVPSFQVATPSSAAPNSAAINERNEKKKLKEHPAANRQGDGRREGQARRRRRNRLARRRGEQKAGGSEDSPVKNKDAEESRSSAATLNSHRAALPEKHKKQTPQRQQRRRRKNKPGTDIQNDNDAERPSASTKAETSTATKSKHNPPSQRSRIHRKHNRRIQSHNNIPTGDNQHQDKELELNGHSFPSLSTVPLSGDPAQKNIGADATSSWGEECLADKLAPLLELERQQNAAQQLQMAKVEDPVVQLTKLPSGNTRMPNSPGGPEEENTLVVTTEEPVAASIPSNTTDNPHTDNSHIHHQPTTSSLPNTKLKWTGSELFKMRHRWLKAVRKAKEEEKRRQEEENLRPKRWGVVPFDEEEHLPTDDDDSSSVSTVSSSEDSCNDPMQPLSLNNAPFDEIDILHHDPPTAEEVPKPIFGLENHCLQSDYPLHCIIYNHAVLNSFHASSSENGSRTEEDAEVVLQRMLTMQDPVDVQRWKQERMDFGAVRELEMYDSYLSMTPNIILPHDKPPNLLSADAVSLTALHLAIIWDLPNAVRLLCTPSSAQQKVNKRGEGEDEMNRTPLMLACELGRVRCIQAIVCAGSLKMDRREKNGGNMAFHFCCMGKQWNHRGQESLSPNISQDNSGGEEILDFDTSSLCMDSMDMLLKYTPVGQQKRAFLLTNSCGQNLLHLACPRGDLPLVEFLLDRGGQLPGIKISKALDAKDKSGYTPFLAAVAADADDVVMHLLTARIPSGPSYSSFGGRPLVVAASNHSVNMTNLLLDHLEMNGSHDEVNSALLKTVCALVTGEGRGINMENACEIINLLVQQGGGNPHLPTEVQMEGKRATEEYDAVRSGYPKGKLPPKDIPLSAAARFGQSEAVRCMLDSYASALGGIKAQRRNDPLLRSQPESYFQMLEEKEDDAVHLSFDAALMISLFLSFQQSNSLPYGRCALVLYKRRNSSFATPRNLSQRAMQWLSECLILNRLMQAPILTNNQNLLEGYYFQAPVVQYRIPGIRARVDCMDWSHVLYSLPWFSCTNGVNCSWMKTVVCNEDLSGKEESNYISALAEDEFYLISGGERLLAHKSIVSARSGKLQAQIRFTEGRTQDSTNRLSVDIDLPLSMAKMLLQHCYHGSVSFGLMKSPLRQCHQLLELALIAEEYLCPSLLLECEIRLLRQTSLPDCICSHCSSGAISSREELRCSVHRRCFDATKNANDDMTPYCEPAGIFTYKTSNSIMSSSLGGLISPQSAIDVLAVAQQLEQSSSFQEGGMYAIKYCQSGSIEDPNASMILPSFGGWDIDVEKTPGAGCITAPFAAAKMAATWVILCHFSAVIRSESYLRQINGENDDDDVSELDCSSGDEDAILLLQACLREVACSPFHRRQNCGSTSGKLNISRK